MRYKLSKSYVIKEYEEELNNILKQIDAFGHFSSFKELEKCCYEDDILLHTFKAGILRNLIATLKRGNPIVRYDEERQKSYIQYPGGRKEYKD